MSDHIHIQGTAALSICESLLLCLEDLGVITKKDVLDVLEDAATAHSVENIPSDEDGHHQEVHALIKQLIKGGNSVRRRK